MGKSFFEVFPALKLDEHTGDIMGQTEVVKVSTTRKQDFIRIYIASNKLIDKADIIKTENSIKKQLFADQDITIKIYEKFSLSAQYTPENLLDIYRESIELELKDYDHMEYSLFRSASFLYPDHDNVIMRLEDSVVGKKKAPDLIRVLSKIFNERCGLSVVLSPEFVEVEKEDKAPDYSEESAKMAKKLEAMEEKEAEKEAAKAAKAAETKQPSAPAKTEGKDSSFAPKDGSQKSFGKRDFGGSYKRSDNPDVLFGRDFDDEAMKLVDLMGELGEVTIHGKIIEFDSRDIRNDKTILIFAVTDFTDTIAVKMFVNT
ncbi:MAG: PolC-type DNA polymerase III, partial [Butyrivibrio sp.]|nr:PolC-type DNA polymerase III [Butyrivibrio sp.]